MAAVHGGGALPGRRLGVAWGRRGGRSLVPTSPGKRDELAVAYRQMERRSRLGDAFAARAERRQTAARRYAGRIALGLAGIGALGGAAVLLRSPRAQLALATRLRRTRHVLPVDAVRYARGSAEFHAHELGVKTAARAGEYAAGKVRQLERYLVGYTPGAAGVPKATPGLREMIAIRKAMSTHGEVHDLAAMQRYAANQAERAPEAVHGYKPGAIDRANVRLKKLIRPLAWRTVGDIDPEFTLKFGIGAPARPRVAETLRFRFGKPEAHVPHPQHRSRARFHHR